MNIYIYIHLPFPFASFFVASHAPCWSCQAWLRNHIVAWKSAHNAKEQLMEVELEDQAMLIVQTTQSS